MTPPTMGPTRERECDIPLDIGAVVTGSETVDVDIVVVVVIDSVVGVDVVDNPVNVVLVPELEMLRVLDVLLVVSISPVCGFDGSPESSLLSGGMSKK